MCAFMMPSSIYVHLSLKSPCSDDSHDLGEEMSRRCKLCSLSVSTFSVDCWVEILKMMLAFVKAILKIFQEVFLYLVIPLVYL